MGGIDGNVNGGTILPGLYAAGECACVSVHGANRLGGNSLLETIVFGKRAGHFASIYVKEKKAHEQSSLVIENRLKEIKDKILRLENSTGTESPAKIKAELRETMMLYTGIFRDESKLQTGVNKIKELKARYKNIRLLSKTKPFNLDLVGALELEGMLELGEVILQGARRRQESRGSHYRTDFPQRDDKNWLKHTLAYYTDEGPRFDYKPVTITRFKPEARVY